MPQIKAPTLAPAAEAEQPDVSAARIGVLLVNLGTPDGTDFWPMWRYLRNSCPTRASSR